MSWKSWRQRLDPEERGVCDGWDNNSDLKAGAGLNTLRVFGLLLVLALSCLGDSDFNRIQTICPDLWKDLAVAWPPAELLDPPHPQQMGCLQPGTAVRTLGSAQAQGAAPATHPQQPHLADQLYGTRLEQSWKDKGDGDSPMLPLHCHTAGVPLLLHRAGLSRVRAGSGLHCSGYMDLLSVLWDPKQRINCRLICTHTSHFLVMKGTKYPHHLLLRFFITFMCIFDFYS